MMAQAFNSPEDDALEQYTLAFFIRIWLEELPTTDSPALWRGHITQAATRERRYVQSLQDIVTFIDTQLQRALGDE